MSYILKAKLLTVDDMVCTMRTVQLDNKPVYAYDTEKGIIVPDTKIKLMKPRAVSNRRYFTLPSRVKWRDMLAVTEDHVMLVEVDGIMDVMIMSQVYDLVTNGVPVRLYKPDAELKTVTAAGSLITRDDLVVHFPATFVMEIELEKLTQIPLVSFDDGSTFVLA